MHWVSEEGSYMQYLRLPPFICGLIFLLTLTVQAQQDDVVKVKTNLVNIDVIVKDKKGKYISDLKAEDFTITENGQVQKIEFFDAPLSGTATPKSSDTAGAAPAPATATRNYVALVLDSQTTDITNLKPVREGAVKYVREQVTDADAVAILSVTNGLQMLQPFTQDKIKLIAAIEKLGSPDSKNFEQK
jgi:VWFA-related protein